MLNYFSNYADEFFFSAYVGLPVESVNESFGREVSVVNSATIVRKKYGTKVMFKSLF